MAEPFEHISGAAVRVIARVLAKKALAESLRRQNIKRPAQASAVSAHLAEHPEIYEEALAKAWELSIRDQEGRINAVLFDDDRRKAKLPVPRTDNAKMSSEISTENPQLRGD